MSISTKHTDWERNAYTWSVMRDTLEGEDTVKFKSEQYLPIPGAMMEDANITAPSTQGIKSHPLMNDEYYFPLSSRFNPNSHRVPAYAAYKSRAQFPNLVSYLFRGLMGLASADSPSVQLPTELEYLFESASFDGLPLSRLFVYVLGEVLLMGRLPLVLDTTGDGKVVFVPYKTERLINWKKQGGKLVLAVFEELVPKTDDEYSHESVKQYRVARLVEGVYTTTLYDNDANEIETRVPQIRGRPLDYIPMSPIGAMNNTVEPDPPPLAPVASTAIQIYQKTADLGQALFLTANPTLVITGVQESPNIITTGPTSAFILPNEAGKVYYTSTDTSAFEFTHKYIIDLYDRSVTYGAQLLDSSKKSAETAETTRLRQTSASATLRSVVMTVGHAIEQSLKSSARWMGLSQAKIDQIKFSPLTEFGSALTPDEQEQLVASWLAGAISHHTVLSNFKKAGILGEGRTEEDELSQLEQEYNDPNNPTARIKSAVDDAGASPQVGQT